MTLLPVTRHRSTRGSTDGGIVGLHSTAMQHDDAAPNGGEAQLLESDMTQAIAARLRDERRRLGLTLHDVAGRSGLSVAMLSKIENAQTSPSLRTLARLSTALELPV